jgi:hypothetical protein
VIASTTETELISTTPKPTVAQSAADLQASQPPQTGA